MAAPGCESADVIGMFSVQCPIVHRQPTAEAEEVQAGAGTNSGD